MVVLLMVLEEEAMEVESEEVTCSDILVCADLTLAAVPTGSW